MKSCHLFTVFLLLLTVSVTQAAESAEAIFTRAAQLADVDLAQSRELYRVAALQFLAGAKTQPATRGPLLYNAGNAFFLAGDLGRAIVAYRRAEQMMPGSPLLRDNLAFVRKQSGNPDEPVLAKGWDALRFWVLPPPVRWLLIAGGLVIFWAELLRRQWTGRRWPDAVHLGGLALAVVMGMTLLVSELYESRRCRGVLIVSSVNALKGPGYGYAPAFTAPLDGGLECDVLRREGEWLNLRLSDGRLAWVQSATVEIWNDETRLRIL